MTLKVTQGR